MDKLEFNTISGYTVPKVDYDYNIKNGRIFSEKFSLKPRHKEQTYMDKII